MKLKLRGILVAGRVWPLSVKLRIELCSDDEKEPPRALIQSWDVNAATEFKGA